MDAGILSAPQWRQPRSVSSRGAGDRAINLTTEYEFLLPVKIGDRLADVNIKGICLDPQAFWFTTERIIRNQNGDVVALARNIMLKHRTPDEVAATGG